jgi:predicted amidophosphoribosyltransferase
VLVPLGWAVWMVDVGRAQRSRLSPVVTRASETAVPPARCENCGAPRRTDGLAFCSDCGLPYGAQRKA